MLFDEGSPAWYEPETEEERQLIEKSISENWPEQKKLAEFHARTSQHRPLGE